MQGTKPSLKALTLCLLLSSSSYADSLGSLLFHGNCITCHHETKSISAPSIIAIQQNYLRAFANKEDFVTYMSKWILNPNVEGSLMSDAIQKYELMPQLGYEKSTLKIIAEYIYTTDFTKEHEGHSE
jgi:hypothetical protein